MSAGLSTEEDIVPGLKKIKILTMALTFSQKMYVFNIKQVRRKREKEKKIQKNPIILHSVLILSPFNDKS